MVVLLCFQGVWAPSIISATAACWRSAAVLCLLGRSSLRLCVSAPSPAKPLSPDASSVSPTCPFHTHHLKSITNSSLPGHYSLRKYSNSTTTFKNSSRCSAAGRCCCHPYCPRTSSTGVVTACCLRSEAVLLHHVCPVCCGLIASKISLKQAAKTTHAAASHVLYVNVVTRRLRKVKHWFSIFRHTLNLEQSICTSES